LLHPRPLGRGGQGKPQEMCTRHLACCVCARGWGGEGGVGEATACAFSVKSIHTHLWARPLRVRSNDLYTVFLPAVTVQSSACCGTSLHTVSWQAESRERQSWSTHSSCLLHFSQSAAACCLAVSTAHKQVQDTTIKSRFFYLGYAYASNDSKHAKAMWRQPAVSDDTAPLR
jgi:hypothetical protein